MFNQGQEVMQALYRQERLDEANRQRLAKIAQPQPDTVNPAKQLLAQIGDGLVNLGNHLKARQETPIVTPVFKKSAGRI